MDSAHFPKPRQQQLSSSISMYIEDSRFIKDEDLSPITRAVSTYFLPPNVCNNVQIKNDEQNWTFSHTIDTGSNSNSCFEGEFQQLPSSSSRSSLSSSSVSASCSSSSSIYHPQSQRNSRPKEVVRNKVIKESSFENEDDNFNHLVDTFSFNHNDNIRHGVSSLPSSRQGSISIRRHSSLTSSLPGDFQQRRISYSESRNPRSNFRTTTLNINPVPPLLNTKENLGCGNRVGDNRTYTSVNLTLRSPSAGSENKRFSPSSEGPALCACGSSIRTPTPFSNNNNNSNNTMTYSTYSGSKDGFEAQVQIHIGPNGGTISASRRRKENVEMQQMNADLISAQSERRDKLEATLVSEKCELKELQQEIMNIRSTLHPLFDDLEKLKDENQRLRIECQLMTREVDLYDNGTLRLGETSEEFYRDIYPGQDVNALFGSTKNRRRRGGVEPGGQYSVNQRNPPPPRPPPPNPKHLPSPQSQAKYGPNFEWTCSMCTFLNHPDLTQCEQCGMVRVSRTPVSNGPSWM